jgi:hypothetical protein
VCSGSNARTMSASNVESKSVSSRRLRRPTHNFLADIGAFQSACVAFTVRCLPPNSYVNMTRHCSSIDRHLKRRSSGSSGSLSMANVVSSVGVVQAVTVALAMFVVARTADCSRRPAGRPSPSDRTPASSTSSSASRTPVCAGWRCATHPRLYWPTWVWDSRYS